MLHIRHSVETNNVPIDDFDQTKPFKVVVEAQKSLSGLLQGFGLSQDILFYLEESIASNFEIVRRFVTLLDMDSNDLNHYIKTNLSEYSADEFYALYKRAHKGASREAFHKIYHASRGPASNITRSTRFK